MFWRFIQSSSSSSTAAAVIVIVTAQLFYLILYAIAISTNAIHWYWHHPSIHRKRRHPSLTPSSIVDRRRHQSSLLRCVIHSDCHLSHLHLFIVALCRSLSFISNGLLLRRSLTPSLSLTISHRGCCVALTYSLTYYLIVLTVPPSFPLSTLSLMVYCCITFFFSLFLPISWFIVASPLTRSKSSLTVYCCIALALSLFLFLSLFIICF